MKHKSMERTFAETLLALRQGRNLSQRTAAADLGISQPLLSHYEKGTREPGLSFVCRVCEYYGVTADYMLGRSENRGTLETASARDFLSQLRALTERGEKALEKIGGISHD